MGIFRESHERCIFGAVGTHLMDAAIKQKLAHESSKGVVDVCLEMAFNRLKKSHKKAVDEEHARRQDEKDRIEAERVRIEREKQELRIAEERKRIKEAQDTCRAMVLGSLDKTPVQ